MLYWKTVSLNLKCPVFFEGLSILYFLGGYNNLFK